jgi:hypothetical protein
VVARPLPVQMERGYISYSIDTDFARFSGLRPSHLPAAGGPPVEGDYDEGYGGCAI